MAGDNWSYFHEPTPKVIVNCTENIEIFNIFAVFSYFFVSEKDGKGRFSGIFNHINNYAGTGPSNIFTILLCNHTKVEKTAKILDGSRLSVLMSCHLEKGVSYDKQRSHH